MLRRSFAGILFLTLVWTVALGALSAQIKELPKKPSRPAALRVIDINSASETEIAGLGLDRAVAKKIVDGRPYRNKHELVSRELLTAEQYDKIKTLIVAKRMKK